VLAEGRLAGQWKCIRICNLCLSQPARRTKQDQKACKPGSVRPFEGSGSHSSGTVIADRLTRHTRGTGVRQPICAPYLVLLRAGFALPALLPGLRWALTPPFHPFPWPFPAFAGWGRRGGLLSVALSLGLRRAAVSRRPVFLEPGLSSRIQLPAYQRLPGLLVLNGIIGPGDGERKGGLCPAGCLQPALRGGRPGGLRAGEAGAAQELRTRRLRRPGRGGAGCVHRLCL